MSITSATSVKTLSEAVSEATSVSGLPPSAVVSQPNETVDNVIVVVNGEEVDDEERDDKNNDENEPALLAYVDDNENDRHQDKPVDSGGLA